MDEKIVETNVETGVDIQRLFAAIWHRLWVIILIAVLTAAVVFAGTLFFVTPLYQSSAMFYVNNSSLSVGDASFSIESGDITAAKNLVDSYIVILKTRESLNDVIDYADVDRTYLEMRDMIVAASVNNTEIFEVVVTSPDPNEAERIAKAISYILPKRINSIIEGTSARIVDSAIVPSSPSSPSYTLNTVIGFIIGFVLSVGFIVLRKIFDITIRTQDDVERISKHPVLTAVPDMGAPSKGSYYYYGYGSKRRPTARGAAVGHKEDPVFVGGEISFAAAEAYKLLRTKLQYSFADDSNSRVIGISSALSGEGKSLSAINLAYTLSQLDKRVILIDCDMRRPTLAEKLKIHKLPGLSGYLTGLYPLDNLIQKCNLKNEEEAFHVITAGQNPPNPIELLSSDRMSQFLQNLRQTYDYVILDLPPVGEVSDAMAVAKITDGMLLVVRENHCDRVVLSDTVRQFEFINAKILGIVYNCSNENGIRYGKGYYKRYYRRYYRRSYGRYEGAYIRRNDAAETKTEEKK